MGHQKYEQPVCIPGKSNSSKANDFFIRRDVRLIFYVLLQLEMVSDIVVLTPTPPTPPSPLPHTPIEKQESSSQKSSPNFLVWHVHIHLRFDLDIVMLLLSAQHDLLHRNFEDRVENLIL